MPDTGNAFDAAKAAVAAKLASLGCATKVLTSNETAAYSHRGFATGWRMPVQFSDGIRRIDLMLPIGFPWQPPRVALVDRPPFLTWPHIECDGILCLATNMLDVDPDDPAGVVVYTLDDAAKLVEHLIAGDLDADFQDEFLSYWDYAANADGPHFISLLRPEPPSRQVRVWRGKNLYILAETDNDLKSWLTNRSGKMPGDFRTEAAAYLWVGTPPAPNDYPQTGQALRLLAASASPESSALLSDLVQARPNNIVSALGFTTTNGPVIASIVVPEPPAVAHGPRDPLLKGFRPGTVPPSLLLTRYLGGTALIRRSVDRADPDWIHGRGRDSRTRQLRHKTIAIIGCGSVGAAVAIALAQAGVGHLLLIDFDTLKWANTGRHPLGSAYVGQFKSKALAEKLRADFPHLEVTSYECDADTAVRRHGHILAGCHLILSATGSWSADSRLDAWHEATNRKVPVIYGWLEAHACAGHAVLIDGPQGSLRAGFDQTGLPHFRLAAWPDGVSVLQEPACGAAYQPYGPIELGFINSLIADLALDILLGEAAGPTHKIWVSPRKRLIQMGGGWSAGWRDDRAFREEGGFIFERPWPAATEKRDEKVRAG
jgi:hypothetical protein